MKTLSHSQVQDEIAKAKPCSRYPVSLYLVPQPSNKSPSQSKLFYLDTEIKSIEQLIELLQSRSIPQQTLFNPKLDRGTIDNYVRNYGVTHLKPNQSTPDLTLEQIALRNLAKKLGYESPTDIAREYTPEAFIAEASAEYGYNRDSLTKQYEAMLTIAQMNEETINEIGDLLK